MHGIDATSASMDHAEALTKRLLPGVFVYKVKIENDTIPDSIFVNMSGQVASMAKQFKAIPQLAGGFNLLCVSQGGQNCRGYIELVNDPPVNAFISWVAVQGGIWGVPNLGPFNPLVDHVLNTIPYNSEIQAHVAPANYWKDPYKLAEYTTRCTWLPMLNNNPDAPSHPDPARKARFASLTHLVALYSHVDTVLIPKETGWFWFYAADSASRLVPVNDTALYRDDWFGLRSLDADGRITWGTTTCHHQDYSSPCFDNHFVKYVIPVLAAPMGARSRGGYF
ncbi:uncharacterized protein AMSG_03119 [Thecamonas trahens ATCC 50062]|uniref:Uncharacterized protein n=1 Tax=Thecamonas trahens ATCC 50062 TaxID=461836 RepID=A0A0L0D2Y0_THETB|nr:hypothetical protein AMSG_03119 [Thecamonas trahens ATCC 50062]KNC46682.1 hypothetical protein AMSG_03119 [Thecamonas trahens ATCC 50062]|eukprot:XP_013760450.1 hypothetical protein AMSG_03119 [Thecamonas trahens ATCC 50062]